MTIEEKLQHFYDTSVTEAQEQAQKELDAHKKSLDEMLEKHKADILSHLNYAIKADAVEVALACKHFGTLVELNGKRVNLTEEEIEKMLENDVD